MYGENLSVVSASLAEFEEKYRTYLQAVSAGENPDRSEIDFYFGLGIPGIDDAAHRVECELRGERPSSNKAA